MDTEEALSICFVNLKGYKDKDLFATAQALRYLRGLPQYNSNDKVGQAVGVSGEIVREFLSLLKLPENIQSLFRQGQLKRLEQVRRLWQLARKRPGLLEETAQALSDLSAWDARLLVDQILRNPDMTVAEAKKAVQESKTVIEREFHVVALLSEQEYKLLGREAQKRNEPVDKLVTFIVQQWLESRGYSG